jgi:hypothetical protein
MPDTMAEVGFGSVDANNAVEASATFFGACAFALYDAAGFFSSSLRPKIQAAVLAAATARGVIGSADSTVGILTNLANQSKGLLTVNSAFIEPDGSQTYFFTAPQGALLSVKLQGQTTGLPLHPDFVIVDENNSTSAAAHTQGQVFTADLRGTSEKGIQLLLPTGSIYKVIVFATNGIQGTYSLSLDI